MKFYIKRSKEYFFLLFMISPTKQKEEKNKRWEISTTSYNGRWLVMNVGCIKKDVSSPRFISTAFCLCCVALFSCGFWHRIKWKKMLNLKKDESEINECNVEESTANAASTGMSEQWCTEEEERWWGVHHPTVNEQPFWLSSNFWTQQFWIYKRD